jgi:hypothetical protein
MSHVAILMRRRLLAAAVAPSRNFAAAAGSATTSSTTTKQQRKLSPALSSPVASDTNESAEFPTSHFDHYRRPAGDTTRRAFSYAVMGGLGLGLATGFKALAVS